MSVLAFLMHPSFNILEKTLQFFLYFLIVCKSNFEPLNWFLKPETVFL